MIINIGLIDYGVSNLHSVEQSFKRLNQSLTIVRKPEDFDSCHALILPGVGSFDPAMESLKRTKMIPKLMEWGLKKKPLLGICLGLQLLFESSEEGNAKGLGLLKGTVKYLPKTEEELIPHMGWALLNQQKEYPLFNWQDHSQWMYFVHSYSALPTNSEDIAASVDFGNHAITAIVWKDSIAACQFHPEKSGQSGELLLSRWLSWVKKESENFN